MKNIEFNVFVNSDTDKLWKTLWEKESYEKWASVFSEGTHLDQYDLKEGNIIQFLGANGDGMYAVIEVLRVGAQMTFQFLGQLKEGKEIPFEMHNTKELAGTESYLLLPQEMGTNLNIEVVIPDEWVSYVEEKYPLALLKIKELAEA